MDQAYLKYIKYMLQAWKLIMAVGQIKDLMNIISIRNQIIITITITITIIIITIITVMIILKLFLTED